MTERKIEATAALRIWDTSRYIYLYGGGEEGEKKRERQNANEPAGESFIPTVNAYSASASRSKLHLKRRGLNTGCMAAYGR